MLDSGLPPGNCADQVEVVDAAFDHPGGPKQKYMEKRVCPGCPIWEECLDEAMRNGEWGPWGGTSQRQRNRNRARTKGPYLRNLRTVEHPTGHP
jgi:hypothetical protein